jgi:multidrug efflux pump subunit AcrA (membrane-fusion protein)
VSHAADKAAIPPPPASSSGESEIIFNGKLSCSLKRRIDLPFKGIITSLRVHSGQRVEAGQILATYKLAPESVLTIQQRLSPPQISEMESKLAEANRGLVPLKNKQRELSQLTQQKLAPDQSLFPDQPGNRVGRETKGDSAGEASTISPTGPARPRF